MEPIQLFVPTFRIEETLCQIRECLEKGWTGLGFKTIEFESEFKKYTELPHAHFLGSATFGLHLALHLFKHVEKWVDGDEIITTPLTFVSTNHSILYENLKPVFADTDEYLCLDPVSVENRITEKTRAVIFVGVGGNTGQLEKIVDLCRKNHLKLILDAAHMTGTRWKNGTHIGGEADASIFSFQAVKNLPTADSGMICFQNPDLDKEVRKLSWMGINKDTFTRTTEQGSYKWLYDVEYEGFKYHGNSIMAAIGLVSLRYVDQDNAYRRQISEWYDEMLKNEPGIRRVPMSSNCVPSRHLYQIKVDRRDEIMLALNQQQIYPGVHYRDNTSYRMYTYAQGTCPNAHQASEQIISLPLHIRLTYKDIKRVSTTLIQTIHHLKP